MLRTALKPFWLLMLVLTIAVSGVFVYLSKWQFDASRTAAPPPREQTENAVPLVGHIRAGEPLLASQADQVLEFRGHFLPGTDVVVDHRLLEGQEGYWVVSAFRPDEAPAGAPEGIVIPVVRGWSAEATAADPAPEGEVTVTGRVLPPEGPLPRVKDGPDTGGRILVDSLSAAQLTNLWDVPSYAAFVAAFDVVDAAGKDVGVGAVPGGLEPVWVAPQPSETSIVWLNVFYAVEWIIFAGFALYLWWRFVRDDHVRDLREAELDAEWERTWRAEELQRRRAEAARAKEEARRAYAAYHGLETVVPAQEPAGDRPPADLPPADRTATDHPTADRRPGAPRPDASQE